MNPEHHHSGASQKNAWLAFRLAGRFLLPFRLNEGVDDPAWSRAAIWLPAWGLLVGIAYAAIFRLAWLWLGEYQRIRLAPMALLLIVDVGFLGYRLLEGAAEVVTSWKNRPATVPGLPVIVLVGLALLGKFSLLISLPAGAVPYPADWREHLSILYPYVIFRPLILMPLWGRWAILLASGIGRVAPQATGPLRSMAQGSSLAQVMVYWVAITLLTVMYCSPAGRFVARSMLISLGMLVVAYVVSFVLARRFGGQTPATVLAAGWVVELSFLLAYLPIARPIYWY